MFSNWFSGDDLERYRTSAHKGRIDGIASSLLRLRYANEVIRQHLHEWLRFSFSLNPEGAQLPDPHAEIVRRYVDQRVAGCSASRSRVLRASVRMRQTNKAAFAGALPARLLPRRGSARF